MIKKKYLENGIILICNEQKSAKLTSLAVGVRVGSSYEEKENEYGLSHFIEHLMFKGTKNKTADEIISTVETLGGEINGFTTDSNTVYFVSGKSSDFDIIADILFDCVNNSIFSQEDIDKEKEIIKQEILSYESDPMYSLIRLHNSHVFKDTNLEHDICGTERNISEFTRDDIISFYNKWYVPDRIVISSVGKCSIEKLEELVKKYFKKQPSQNNLMHTYWFNTGFKEKKEGILQTYVLWTFNPLKIFEEPDCYKKYHSLNINNWSTKVLNLFNNFFIDGMSSRFFKRVREELGLVYECGSIPFSYTGINVPNFYVICDYKNVQKIENELFNLLKDVQNGFISEMEFEKAKNMKEVSLLEFDQSSSNNAVSILIKFLENYQLETKDILKDYKKLKKEDLILFADKILNKENFNRFELYPETFLSFLKKELKGLFKKIFRF